MQPVEDFLRDYFRNRTELLRISVPAWQAHLRQFFAPGYRPFDPTKFGADSEQEQILSTRISEGAAEVITSGWLGVGWRARYQLAAVDAAWRITRMEIECGICHGSGKAKDGKSDCRLCKGAGWR